MINIANLFQKIGNWITDQMNISKDMRSNGAYNAYADLHGIKFPNVYNNSVNSAIKAGNAITNNVNPSSNNILGNILKNTSNNASDYQTDQMIYNANQAEINRQWQTEMSNTAHQREVADLKAAGLNPILSANNGASVGSVSNASANSMDLAKLSAATTLAAAQIQANSAATVAGIYAGATRYSADKQFAANFSSQALNLLKYL